MTGATAPSMPLPFGWARDVVRHWGWRTSVLAVLIGAATLFDAGVPLSYPLGNTLAYLFALLYNVLQFGFPLIFAIQMADRAVDHGVPALWAYSIAVVVTGQVGVWIVARLLWPVLGKAAWWGLDDDVAMIFTNLPFHGLCVGAYAFWRGERAARERLLAAERDRAIAQRRIITSRLLALQARVEPQLLFDALGRIDAALDSEDGLADRRLADLIDLLRAMQPAIRQHASTLTRELALVAAHARVSGAPGLQPDLLHVVVADAAAHVRLAPLVLLPLLRWLTTPNASGWRVEAAVTGGRLSIEATTMDGGTPTCFAPTPQPADIDEWRQRLVAVHGSSAELRVDSEVPRLWLEVDAEYDAHPDRRG